MAIVVFADKDIHKHVYTSICIHIYIYCERERERDGEKERLSTTVSCFLEKERFISKCIL